MTLEYRIHPDALDELDAAVAWHDQGGHGSGQRLQVAYYDVVDRCLMWLDSAAAYPLEDQDVVVRTAKVSLFPFRVVYFVEGDVFQVGVINCCSTVIDTGAAPVERRQAAVGIVMLA